MPLSVCPFPQPLSFYTAMRSPRNKTNCLLPPLHPYDNHCSAQHGWLHGAKYAIEMWPRHADSSPNSRAAGWREWKTQLRSRKLGFLLVSSPYEASKPEPDDGRQRAHQSRKGRTTFCPHAAVNRCRLRRCRGWRRRRAVRPEDGHPGHRSRSADARARVVWVNRRWRVRNSRARRDDRIWGRAWE